MQTNKKYKYEKIKYCFLVFFTIIPLFCVILDLLFSTIQPDPQYGDSTKNFDFSIINQSIYFSVWIALSTSVYGILNWINCHTKNMPTWITGKNNLTHIATLNLGTFIVFNLTMIISPNNIVGFNTWYKILKSILEHILVPIIVIFYYFFFRQINISTNQYFKKYCWYNLIVISIYLFYVSLRVIMLMNFLPPEQEAFTAFPYDQLNPYKIGWILFFLGITAFLVSTILISTLLNFLSNLIKKSVKKNPNNP
ncbi:hypothetical protein [Spiroplasma endosymbiont of Lariophagus distinguendus]|uniref:hypothetical protein n=1 Tax=Spiroplasma endosymbiont of Lariophagus distinguendus TaxID=2935082 RepID=UPI002079673D|nr:hypothetical protein [Spiroplasma endosymbiont of Lariophagus distinguendus]